MTKEKLKSVFEYYFKHIEERWAASGVKPKQMNLGESSSFVAFINTDAQVSHFLFMCQEAQKFVDEGRIEKAMRWLGFIQGVLWADNEFTLDDLKNHSRPDEDSK
jgi:hypothetical protein